MLEDMTAGSFFGIAGRIEKLVYRFVSRPDHNDSGSMRAEIVNVIDSFKLDRDAGGTPFRTFPHPALSIISEKWVAVFGKK